MGLASSWRDINTLRKRRVRVVWHQCTRCGDSIALPETAKPEHPYPLCMRCQAPLNWGVRRAPRKCHEVMDA
jgi:uncharacterized paraquat-inducible protein A